MCNSHKKFNMQAKFFVSPLHKIYENTPSLLPVEPFYNNAQYVITAKKCVHGKYTSLLLLLCAVSLLLHTEHDGPMVM